MLKFVAAVVTSVVAGCRFAGATDFSWHTVPVFCETSNVTGVFDEEALDTIAK